MKAPLTELFEAVLLIATWHWRQRMR